ncbi:MAG: SGNH/GDSL hydrolase family protein [Pirellulaceae bacterium]
MNKPRYEKWHVAVRRGYYLLFCYAALTFSPLPAAEPFGSDAKRILFLGDSITHAGDYIALIETQMLLQRGPAPEIINLGLPSETCSGLSEPAHPFPRPNVHERLDRALQKIEADVVVVCYGMNDGIYYPFADKRFKAYQRGIERLVAKVTATGATLVVMTPPAFDPLPLKKKGKLKPAGAAEYAWFEIYEGYDGVLERYANWLVQRRDNRVKMVIDLHSPVTAYVNEKRRSDSDFTMSPDGVHVNHEGHTVLARAILDAWGYPVREVPPDLLALVVERQKLMHDAWLSHVGHKRPGMKAGLPIDEARKRSQLIQQRIDDRLSRTR